MSSTSNGIPLTRRIQGGLATLIGVVVAIAVAVTLIAVTGSNNRAQRTVKPDLESITPTFSSLLASSPPHERRYVMAIAPLGPRHLGAGYGTGPAAAAGTTASTQTAQNNPYQPPSDYFRDPVTHKLLRISSARKHTHHHPHHPSTGGVAP
jgi:hypothetical protein